MNQMQLEEGFAPWRRMPGAAPASVVTPFARALALLGAFTPRDGWLSNRELAARCGMPASTVWRLAQSLVIVGYLHYSAESRKYRLAASVLALGYGAIGHGGLQRAAREPMQAYADRQCVQVSLATRDRLDIVALESFASPQMPALNLRAVARAGLASSPMGWALLAGLPESERCYLVEKAERRAPRDWPRWRRCLGEAVAQVRMLGYCSSISDWDCDLGIVSAPVLAPGRAPRVVSCIGAAGQFTRARVQRGFVRRARGGREFELADAARGMGDALVASSEFVCAAECLMQAWADRLGVSVALAMPEGLDMLYVAYRAGQGVATLRLSRGSVLPMAGAADGPELRQGGLPARTRAGTRAHRAGDPARRRAVAGTAGRSRRIPLSHERSHESGRARKTPGT